jgi:nitrite reductase (NO-forming)
MRLAYGKMLYLAILFLSLDFLFLVGCHASGMQRDKAWDPATESVQGMEPAATASAPNVPPPITRNYSTRVILDVEIREQVMTLSDGVSYLYWSFGGETPAKFIRVRQGDMVETRLHNHPDNMLAHNIDFHGASGPGGGGEASFIAPGHTAVFSWRAMNPGLFLYHCVAAPAGWHISNGMYGLILVEPREGLPKVDREYYIAQGEFYTKGAFGEPGLQEFSQEKALKESPEYVVFNGKVGALMGANALKAKTGEKVRIYLANAGPALISSFHIVGEIFDNVYGEGGSRITQQNVQTTMIPVGGSAMVEFTPDIPGEYTLVDHSMFRAFNKGAMGQLRVEGPENELVFTGRTFLKPYDPGTSLNRLAAADEGPVPKTHAELMAQGEKVYATLCITCHQADARGLPNAFPPLAKSDFLMADKLRAMNVLLHGLKGTVTVNGNTFNSEMPKFTLTNAQIASALTYVRNSFGNKGDVVTVEEVAAARAVPPSDSSPTMMATASRVIPAKLDKQSIPTPKPVARGPED